MTKFPTILFLFLIHAASPMLFSADQLFSPSAPVKTDEQMKVAHAVLNEWIQRRYDPAYKNYVDDNLLKGMGRFRLSGKKKLINEDDFTGIVFTIFSIEFKEDQNEAVVAVETITRLPKKANTLFLDEYVLRRNESGKWTVSKITNQGTS
jgi:hypothetical protein